MKILLLDYSFPFPSDSGGKVRTANIVKALYVEHEISMLCAHRYVDLPGDEKGGIYFKDIWVAPKEQKKARRNYLRQILNIIKKVPWEITATYSKAIESKFREILNKGKYDLIIARDIYQAQYLIRNIRKIKCAKVVDLADIEYSKIERSNDSKGYKNQYDQLRKRFNCYFLRNYHHKLGIMDIISVCSDIDATSLYEVVKNKKIQVLPNCIDFDKYDQIASYDQTIHNNKIILFCGLLSYEPNIKGLKRFVTYIYPAIKDKIPEVRLHIVGAGPTQAVLDLEDNKSIFVYRDVPSVLPYYQNASIVVVPIYVGSGTRIKIIEAFASKRPVITTSIGIEGLEAVSKTHYLKADSDQEFSSTAIYALNEYDVVKNITENAYALAKGKYGFDNFKAKLTELIKHASC